MKSNKNEQWVARISPSALRDRVLGYTRQVKEKGSGPPRSDLGGGVEPFLRSISVPGVYPPNRIITGGFDTSSVELSGCFDAVYVEESLPVRTGLGTPKPLKEPDAPSQEQCIQHMKRSQLGNENGIVVSNNNFRYGGTLPYFDAPFYSWRASNAPDADAPLPEGSILRESGLAKLTRQLEYLVQFIIANEDARAITHHMYEKYPSEVPRMWGIEFWLVGNGRESTTGL